MEGVHARDEALHVVLLSEKPYVLVNVQLMGEALSRATLRAVTRQEEFRVHLLTDPSQYLNAIEHALDRAKVRDMQDSLPTSRRR